MSESRRPKIESDVRSVFAEMGRQSRGVLSRTLRDDRDRVPIVTNESGQIVWVAGEVLADPFRVTPLTKSVVVLTLRR